MATVETQEERLARLKMAAQTQSGLNTALADVMESQRKLVQGAAERGSKDWRAAVAGMARWQSAMHSGDYASARETLVDIAKLKTYEAPVDQDVLYRVQDLLATNAATAGLQLGSPELQQAAWQQFIRLFPGAKTNEATLGTLRAMEDKYGPMNAAYLANDSGLTASWQDIQQKAAAQADALAMLKGYASAIESATQGIPANASPDQVSSVLRSISSKYEPGRLTSAMAAVERMAAAGPPGANMTPEERALYEEGKKAQATLMAKITTPEAAYDPKDTRRDRIAAIIATPAFQWWAQHNGYDVGTVTPAEKGVTYSDGVETPSGIYSPGPDDLLALQFAQQQQKRRDGQPFHAAYMHRALDGERKTYATVDVVQPESVTRGDTLANTARTPSGDYVWVEQNGERTAITEPVVFVRDDSGAIYVFPAAKVEGWEDVKNAGLAGWQDLGSAYYDPQTTTAVPAEVAKLLQHSATPPTRSAKTPPLQLHGQLLAPHVGDPIGSVRLLTESGERLIPQEEQATEPVVVSGGGEKQTLRRFSELVRGRRAHNRAEREPEVFDAADRAAEAVVPDQYSAKEQEALRRRNEDAEQAQRAQQRAAGTVNEVAGARVVTPAQLRQDPEERLEDTAAEKAAAERVRATVQAGEEADAARLAQYQRQAEVDAQEGAKRGLGLKGPGVTPAAGTNVVERRLRMGVAPAKDARKPTTYQTLDPAVQATIDAAAADASAKTPPSHAVITARRRRTPE